MINNIIRFFAQYYLYVVIGVISTYFLFIVRLPTVFFVVGSMSLISSIVARSIKKIVAKKRSGEKHQLFTPKNIYAFPSTHASGLSSFMVTTYSYLVWEYVVISVIVILLARVLSHVHDYRDIIGGVFVGVIVTKIVLSIMHVFSL